MAKKRKVMHSHVPVVNVDAVVSEKKDKPPWAYFKPQITDKDIFDSLKKIMKWNAKRDRWMLEE